MPIVQAINGIVETYPVRPVTPREPVVDAVDSQAGKEPRQQAGDRTQQAARIGVAPLAGIRVGQLCRRQRLHDLAAIHHDDPVAEGLHEMQIVADEDQAGLVVAL